MAGPASLFDSPSADARATPDPPDRPPTTRLRAALLVALLTVGLADLAVVRQTPSPRAVDTAKTPVTPPPAVMTTPPAPTPTSPALAPPTAAPAADRSAKDAADIAFVRRYYALLPGRPGDAFRLLAGPARARSGGYVRFSAFYSGIVAVSVDPTPAVVAPSTVAAVIRFRRRTGEVTHERYELVVATTPDGRRVLQSYRRT